MLQNSKDQQAYSGLGLTPVMSINKISDSKQSGSPKSVQDQLLNINLENNEMTSVALNDSKVMSQHQRQVTFDQEDFEVHGGGILKPQSKKKSQLKKTSTGFFQFQTKTPMKGKGDFYDSFYEQQRGATDNKNSSGRKMRTLEVEDMDKLRKHRVDMIITQEDNLHKQKMGELFDRVATRAAEQTSPKQNKKDFKGGDMLQVPKKSNEAEGNVSGKSNSRSQQNLKEQSIFETPVKVPNSEKKIKILNKKVKSPSLAKTQNFDFKQQNDRSGRSPSKKVPQHLELAMSLLEKEIRLQTEVGGDIKKKTDDFQQVQREQKIINWQKAFMGRPKMQNVVIQFTQDLKKLINDEAVQNDLQQIQKSEKIILDNQESIMEKFAKDIQSRMSNKSLNSMANKSIQHAKQRFIKIQELKKQGSNLKLSIKSQGSFNTQNSIMFSPQTRNQKQYSFKFEDEISPLKLRIKKRSSTTSQDTFSDDISQIDEERSIVDSTGKLYEQESKQKMSKLIQECVFSPQQIAATQSLEEMGKMIGQFDEDNRQQKKDIRSIERELEKIGQEKQRLKGPMIPGKKLQEFIQHWDDLLEKNQYDPVDIIQYGTEFSKTLKEYEVDLKAIETGQKILLKQQKQSYEQKIADIKEKTSIRIEALERALNYSKLKTVRDRERAQMRLSEMESRLLNNQKSVKDMDKLIMDCQQGKTFKSMREAHEVIRKLTDMLISSKETQTQQEQQIQETKQKLRKNTDMGMKIKENLYKENNMRSFYQKIVLKICRDIEIFSEDNIKIEQFNQINEYDENVNHQVVFKTTLKHLNIEKEIINFINSHQQNHEIIQKQNEFLQDLVDRQKEEMREFLQNSLQEQFRNKKKIKIEQIQEFNNQFLDNMDDMLDGVLDFAEEVLDHQPEQPRASSQTGKKPQNFDELFMKQKMKKEFRRNNNSKSKRQENSNYRFSQFSSQNKIDDDENYSFKFSSFSQSNLNKNQSPPGMNNSFNQLSLKDELSESNFDLQKSPPGFDIQSQSKYSYQSGKNSRKFFQFKSRRMRDTLKKDYGLSQNDDDSMSQKDQTHSPFEMDRRVDEQSVHSMSRSQKTGLNRRQTKRSRLSQANQSENKSQSRYSLTFAKLKSQKTKSVHDKNASESSESSESEVDGICKKCGQKKTDDQKPAEQPQQPEPLKNPLTYAMFQLQIIEEKPEHLQEKQPEIQEQSDDEVCDSVDLDDESPFQALQSQKTIQFEFNQINRLKYEHFKSMVDDQIMRTIKDGKVFYLDDDQVQQMKLELIESLGSYQLSEQQDIMMTKNDMKEIFEGLNKIIDNHSEFVSDKMQQKRDKKNKFSIGDILMPQISKNGSILKFKVNSDMARVIFLKSGKNMNILKRIIRTVNYMNRLVKDGLNEDKQYQMKDENCKQSVEIQVDFMELEQNAQGDIDELTRHNKDGKYMEQEFLKMLKNHVIELDFRNRISQKNQQAFKWKDIQLDDLLVHRIDRVFYDQNDVSESKDLPIGSSVYTYLKDVFELLNFKLSCLNDSKEIFVEKLMLNSVDNINQLKDLIGNTKELQQKREEIVLKQDQSQQTNEDQLVAHKGCQTKKQKFDRGQKYARNQMVLDEELKNQMKDTLDIFDLFLKQIRDQQNMSSGIPWQELDQMYQAFANFNDIFNAQIIFDDQQNETPTGQLQLKQSIYQKQKNEKMGGFNKKFFETQNNFLNSHLFPDEKQQQFSTIYQDNNDSRTTTAMDHTSNQKVSKQQQHQNVQTFSNMNSSADLDSYEDKSYIVKNNEKLNVQENQSRNLADIHNSPHLPVIKHKIQLKQNSSRKSISRRNLLNQSVDFALHKPMSKAKQLTLNMAAQNQQDVFQGLASKQYIEKQQRTYTDFKLHVQSPQAKTTFNSPIGLNELQTINEFKKLQSPQMTIDKQNKPFLQFPSNSNENSTVNLQKQQKQQKFDTLMMNSLTLNDVKWHYKKLYQEPKNNLIATSTKNMSSNLTHDGTTKESLLTQQSLAKHHKRLVSYEIRKDDLMKDQMTSPKISNQTLVLKKSQIQYNQLEKKPQIGGSNDTDEVNQYCPQSTHMTSKYPITNNQMQKDSSILYLHDEVNADFDSPHFNIFSKNSVISPQVNTKILVPGLNEQVKIIQRGNISRKELFESQSNVGGKTKQKKNQGQKKVFQKLTSKTLNLNMDEKIKKMGATQGSNWFRNKPVNYTLYSEEDQ